MPRRAARLAFILVLPLVLAGPESAGVKPAAAKGASSAPRLNVKSWELKNGLRVLFLADHKAPIATVQVFYDVGSKDEHVGIRGVAHMFEHMMFKGSEHVPPEDHVRLLTEVGGAVNAATSEDVTMYHNTVPPSYIGFAMKLEAERMRNLKILPETVASEARVVMEEKRVVIDNNPIGKAGERFRALAYRKHNYAWTPAGVIEDLQKVTPADCQKFYDTYYVPNNATLIVVGDTDEASVRKLVEAHFGAIPRGAAVPRNNEAEPPQDKLRDETMELEVQIPVILGGYHVPKASSPDMAALQVLASILSGGDSSRLNQRLVRKEKLAIAAGGALQSLEDPGLFIVYAAHLPDKDQAQIRKLLMEELERVRNEPVSAAELDKARNQLAAKAIFGLQSVAGIAGGLGSAQYVEGDWRAFLKEADGSRYLKVTAADIKRVAQKYFTDSNLTLVSLKPKADGNGGAK